MRSRKIRHLVAGAVAAAALAVAARANAKPTVNCVDAAAGRSKVVYVTGSTALKPFFSVLAPILAKDSPAYTIVYLGAGSCAGVASVMDPAPSKRQLKDPPDTPTASYAAFFKSDGSSQDCWLDNNDGNGPKAGSDYPVADIGASDVYAASCNYSPLVGETVQDYQGPIQPMTFVVPAASTQRSISAEAAYLAFGTGGGAAAPWIDPKFFFVRNSGSGTQQMIARAINVPATQWWGKDQGGSSQVATGLRVIVDTPTAEKSIGIVSVDVADAERANLHILAFKGQGQSCGYYPDSTVNSRDKKNVRDGHYPIWGPAHLYAQIKGAGPSEAAAALVGRFATPRLEQSVLDAVISRGLVPQCAMHVVRNAEMGQLASFAPTFECGCYFDQKSDGKTSCKPCAGAGECSPETPACNFGFCEKR